MILFSLLIHIGYMYMYRERLLILHICVINVFPVHGPNGLNQIGATEPNRPKANHLKAWLII
jgi:hypothetical protein